jgi:hypothetical protein
VDSTTSTESAATGGRRAVDPALPGLNRVIDRLTKATFDGVVSTPSEAEVRRVEERALVDRVMWLASASPNAQVPAIAAAKLLALQGRMRPLAPRSANRRWIGCAPP